MNWCLRLRAEELLQPTKGGSFDDSVTLDRREVPWLAILLRELKKGNIIELLFPGGYPLYVK